MNDWIVDIETSGEIAAGEGDLERFAAALDAGLGTTGAATSLDTDSRTISAAFTIAAVDAVSAAELGVAAFRHALAASDLALGEPTRVAVERASVRDAVVA